MSRVFFFFLFVYFFISLFCECLLREEGDSQVQEILVEFDGRVKINND